MNADLYNGGIVRVANSFVFKAPVFNYSGDFPFLWDEITLPVRYGSDWEYARTVQNEIVDEICKDYAIESAEAWSHAVDRYRLEPAKIEPMITLAATDNWIQFTIRYIVDYRKRRFVRDRIRRRQIAGLPEQEHNRYVESAVESDCWLDYRCSSQAGHARQRSGWHLNHRIVYASCEDRMKTG